MVRKLVCHACFLELTAHRFVHSQAGSTGSQFSQDADARDPGPIVGGKQGSLDPKYGQHCQADSTQASGFACTPGTGSLPRSGTSPFTTLPDPDQQIRIFQVNPNWGRPTAYQAVRSFRFTARFTF